MRLLQIGVDVLRQYLLHRVELLNVLITGWVTYPLLRRYVVGLSVPLLVKLT